MNTWKNSLRNAWIILWRYLNQPLFDQDNPTVLDPWKFDRYNKIQFLENCWELHPSSKEKHS